MISAILSAGAAALAFGPLATAYEFGTQTGSAGWLADHNYFRCMHGASPVKWDSDLAKRAQAVADGLAKANSGLKHSGTYDSAPYSGENLASGSGTHTCNGVSQAYNQHCAVWAWYNEYNKFLTCAKVQSGAWKVTSGIGHFTAMNWKGIDIIGCGVSGKYYVCHYSHELCKTSKSAACTGTTPPHLPNFNISKCKGTDCLDCYKPELQGTCGNSGSSPATTTTTRAVTTTAVTTRAKTTASPISTTTTRMPETTPSVSTTIAPTTFPTTGPGTGMNDFGKFDDVDGWVADHNYFRCRHGAAPLKWDADLAKKAQVVADGLAKVNNGLKHSDHFHTVPYSGENLAYGRGQFTCNGVKQEYGQHCAVWYWYNEYNQFLTPSKTDGTAWASVSGIGHFTNMVWKGINMLGCARSGIYFVCEYSHDVCKTSMGSACTGTSPPHMSNWNLAKCQPGVCLESAKPAYEAKCST